jgi:hypothetical protein
LKNPAQAGCGDVILHVGHFDHAGTGVGLRMLDRASRHTT